MQVNTSTLDQTFTPSQTVVGDAVGVSERNWYVAIVNHNTEKATAERLNKLGYDTYVATQEDYRIWSNGRRAKIDRVVIPSTIFIRCTEAERLQVVRLPQIFRFLTNRAARQGDAPAPPAIIPPAQLYKLRFMLGNSDSPVGFTTRIPVLGDKVRVIRGGLRGLEGEVLQTTPTELLVRLDILGCARVSINPHDLQPLPA